jgi:undecaprenyl-diphosphatase
VPVWKALVLGLTQGLSEFLPISSSGHLILVPWLFHWTDVLQDASANKTFDVALHMGTLAAVIVYFRRDIVRLLGSALTSLRHRRIDGPDERLVWLVLLATIPAALAGALGESFFEDKAGQPWVIAIALGAFGLVMLAADRLQRLDRRITDLTFRDAAAVGVAQALALVPGVSRSGVTITTGVALRQTRETAARFSFLLSIPVIGGAGLYKGLKLLSDGAGSISAASFIVGIAASAVSGFFAVAALLRFLERRSLVPFVVYRLVMAAFVLTLIVTGVRGATLPG